jgi:hypothetical protein
MPFHRNELNQGIEYWRHTNWPQDFHNGFYQHIAEIRAQGLFNQQWWDAFLPILRQWRATRPRSSEYLTERAQNRFAALNYFWNQNIVPVVGQDIEMIEWLHIAPFVLLVAEIKNVQSPVFSSKLCHFLAPQIFPVVDNAAMGNPFCSYEEYFNAGRQEWHETDDDIKEELMDIITNEIGLDMLPDYPEKCKIIELCFIGRNQNNGYPRH